ncbi:hypothetical protein Vi05172_g4674 [Venturia inaequalis]|uniref:Mid2 domain-containing protein n=1 Tax=Venturia inaequalis TaxID=5025 RepID=A0A8H3ZB06_VENIN|nr:hypothetical protein EG327_002399 [Venturia inaequalis]RDI85328.1 hypothetical protein Vi05172_g4674 [Venturia inaequalis]
MKPFILSAFSFIAGCYCNANDQGMFLNPADGVRNAAWSTNPIWAVGEKHTLKWNTTQTTYNISLWQQNTGTNIAGQGVSPVFSWSGGNGIGPGTYDWIVQPAAYGFDIHFSPVFFLYIGPGFSITDAGVTSRYFNISASSTATTPSASVKSTPASTTTSTSGAGNATTKFPNQSTASGISTAIKLGLGVGLGIGIPLLLILGVVAGMSLVQRRRNETQELDVAPSYYDPHYRDVKPSQQFGQQELPTEPSPTHHRAELYGGP